MPGQHIDGSAPLDSGLSPACITRHLSLPFSSPNNRNRLAILILTQANPFSMTLPISSGLELPFHPKFQRLAIFNRFAAEC
jgi:hypothetical protein